MLYTIFKVTSPNIILNNSAVLVLSFNTVVHCAGWVQLVSVCVQNRAILYKLSSAATQFDPLRHILTRRNKKRGGGRDVSYTQSDIIEVLK